MITQKICTRRFFELGYYVLDFRCELISMYGQARGLILFIDNYFYFQVKHLSLRHGLILTKMLNECNAS